MTHQRTPKMPVNLTAGRIARWKVLGDAEDKYLLNKVHFRRKHLTWEKGIVNGEMLSKIRNRERSKRLKNSHSTIWQECPSVTGLRWLRHDCQLVSHLRMHNISWRLRNASLEDKSCDLSRKKQKMSKTPHGVWYCHNTHGLSVTNNTSNSKCQYFLTKAVHTRKETIRRARHKTRFTSDRHTTTTIQSLKRWEKLARQRKCSRKTILQQHAEMFWFRKDWVEGETSGVDINHCVNVKWTTIYRSRCITSYAASETLSWDALNVKTSSWTNSTPNDFVLLLQPVFFSNTRNKQNSNLGCLQMWTNSVRVTTSSSSSFQLKFSK